MNCKAVIGLGFGDEGKGLVTDYLCFHSANPLVIRFSGGHQAGHTVIIGDIRHVFSNFGSGTLRGVHTYWDKHCTIEPIGLINEYNTLKNLGVKPVLYINNKCPVTTPYDVFSNNYSEYLFNGTCGVGFGTTVKREKDNYGLHASDLRHHMISQWKIDAIKAYYGMASIDMSDFYEAVDTMLSLNSISFVDSIPSGYSDLILEGSQGILLDKKHGFFPNVTYADTDTTNIAKMAIKPDLYLVTRAYHTRHGNGPMPNRSQNNLIRENFNETNKENDFQGEFRRSLLDLDLLQYAVDSDINIRNDRSKVLVITCMDHMTKHKVLIEGKVTDLRSKAAFISTIARIVNPRMVLISESPDSSNIYNPNIKW